MRSFGKQVKTLFSVQNLFEWFRKAHILSTFSSNFRFPHLISEISIRTNHSVYRNTRFRSYIRRLVLWNGPSECFCTRNRTYQFQFFWLILTDPKNELANSHFQAVKRLRKWSQKDTFLKEMWWFDEKLLILHPISDGRETSNFWNGSPVCFPKLTKKVMILPKTHLINHISYWVTDTAPKTLFGLSIIPTHLVIASWFRHRSKNNFDFGNSLTPDVARKRGSFWIQNMRKMSHKLFNNADIACKRSTETHHFMKSP